MLASILPSSAPLARLSPPLASASTARPSRPLPSLAPLVPLFPPRPRFAASPAFHSAPCRVSRPSPCCSASEAMATQSPPSADSAPRVIKLQPIPLSREAFAAYGEVVEPAEDGVSFGEEDAALDLSQGKPRVYIMRLRDRELGFDRITHHSRVTQCLAAVGGSTWYLGVAPPSLVVDGEDDDEGVKQGAAGQRYRAPDPAAVKVFRIAGPAVVKLHGGTWHAGPLFQDAFMDFFNLELADTNVVDHTTHCFKDQDGVVFEFDA